MIGRGGLVDAGVADLHAQGLTGAGVVVGHLDSGVDGRHRSLRRRVADVAVISASGESTESVPAVDTGLHGTYTAGLLVGRGVDGFAGGIAPRAALVAAAVLEGGDTIARLIAGLDHVVGWGARIVCLPAGVAPPSPALRSVMRDVRRRGVLVICPTGNGGAGRCLAPADAPDVLSIGAAAGPRIATFSGSDHSASGLCLAPLVIAPGVRRIGPSPGDALMAPSGTSSACAVATGVVALLAEAVPSASVDDLVEAVVATAAPPGAADRHLCVSGFIDPCAALDHLQRRSRPGGAQGSAVDDANRSNGRWDPRLDELHLRDAPDAPQPAVLVCRDHDSMRDVLSAAGIEVRRRFEHVPAAIVRAPLDALRAIAGHRDIEAVGSTTCRHPSLSRMGDPR